VTREKQSVNLAEWITTSVVEFTGTKENTLINETNEPAFGMPLVGFAQGNDLLWEEYKRHIGSFYWAPAEIFAETFPSVKATPEELTVVSWILPHTEQTKSAHRKETVYPSEHWARARKYGEVFNVKLRQHMVKTLMSAGYEALAPQLSPLWKEHMSEQYGFASTWSERHAAYAAGLGTFGLSDGLITPLGKAMRCGSVIARIQVPASARPYDDHHAYCLFFSKGTCSKCMDRCPVGAITKEEGHNKEKCKANGDYASNRYGFESHCCGLCQVGVPCESRIPLKIAEKLVPSGHGLMKA
jgi:epoxyqueuosine reductase